MDLLSDHTQIFCNSTVIESLKSKNIFTALDFLNCDNKLIEKASNLTFREILDIRKELLKKYSAPPENAYDYYQYILSHCAIIQTGIPNLDHLLGGGLFTGNIYEICGPPSSGKTLFCLTLMRNMTSSMKDAKIYYLDTKYDFQALKFKRMLSHLSKERVLEVMNNILVLRLKTKEELLNNLKELREVVENSSNVKLIIIDSLPPLYFQSSDHTENNSFLNYMVNILRYLAVRCNIVVVVTNLVTLWNEGDFKSKKSMTERIACGGYWNSVPNVRLKFNKVDSTCDITLSKSRRILPEVCHCQVKINDTGLI